MEIAQAFDALSKIEGTTEALDAIRGHIGGLNAESASHRKSATEYKTKAEQADTLTKLLSEHGFDPAADLVAQFADIRTRADKGGTADDLASKVAKMQRELDSVIKAKQEAETAAQASAAKARAKAVEAAFGKTIADNFHGAEFILRTLASDGVLTIDEEEKPVVMLDGNKLDPDAGLAELRKRYAEAAKNIQNSGGGTSNNANRNTTGGLTEADKLKLKRAAMGY